MMSFLELPKTLTITTETGFGNGVMQLCVCPCCKCWLSSKFVYTIDTNPLRTPIHLLGLGGAGSLASVTLKCRQGFARQAQYRPSGAVKPAEDQTGQQPAEHSRPVEKPAGSGRRALHTCMAHKKWKRN